MTGKAENPWEGETLAAAVPFALRCRELYAINPYSEPPLERVINDLMTELWDNGFSQTEIRNAFLNAVADMPRYAAGKERRGDNNRLRDSEA